MYSFDFGEIEALQAAGDWAAATTRMVDAAERLERGGAGCIVICSNTMHRMAPDIEAALDLPLIHIADATARPIVDGRLSAGGFARHALHDGAGLSTKGAWSSASAWMC